MMRMLLIKIFAAAGLAIGALGMAAFAPLPVSVATGANEFVQFESFAISPDGRFVAYQLKDGKRTLESPVPMYTRSGAPTFIQGSDIWLTDLQTKHTVDLTGARATSWSPTWSSDGKRLAFLSDRGGNVHVWVWNRLTNRQRRISAAIVHGLDWSNALHWVDGDKKILTTLSPEGMSVADARDFPEGYVVERNGRKVLSRSTIRVYSNDPSTPNNQERLAVLQGYDGSMNGNPYDYASIDVANGAVTRMFKNADAAEMAISDDQRYIVMKAQSGSAEDQKDQPLYDITVTSLVDGKQVFKLHDVPMAPGWTPSWRPGSDAFVYTTGARSAQMSTKLHGVIGESFLVTIPSGTTRKITGGEHPPFGMYNQSLAWSASGKRLYYVVKNHIWVCDVASGTVRQLVSNLPVDITDVVDVRGDRVFEQGNRMYVVIREPETKREGIAAIDVRTGAIAKQMLLDKHLGSQSNMINGLPGQHKIVYVAEDGTHPWDLWITDPDFMHQEQLTHLNPELERYHYGPTQLVSWQIFDGQRCKAALILPPDYVKGKRYPTIIYQYPYDPKSDNLNKFGGEGVVWGNFQLYATRGYVVVMPDFTWNGFEEADITNGKAVKWLDSLLDYLVASGISEPGHFGLEGASNGGYSTLAFVTQTNRLSAVISDSGLSSQLSVFSEFSPNGNAFYVNQQERLAGGTPWNALDNYIAESPFFKFDRVHTPVMLVQGSAAKTIQEKEAEDSFVALRRLDKEVTYVLYLGDGHTRSSFTYPHEVDYWTRAIQWYDRHLKRG